MKLKNSKGITLIALVITIIVLLILAGVSISAIMGENGIATKAKEAKKETEKAKLEEEEYLKDASDEIDYYVNGATHSKHVRAGDYVVYDFEGEEIVCRVLYGASSKYGLQIITNDALESISLIGSSSEIAKSYYNDAIEILNSATEKYLNPAYATDIRCVGSNPLDKTKEAESNEVLPNGVDTGYKAGDYNYITDLEQMEELGIHNIGEDYFLASRIIEYDEGYVYEGYALRYSIYQVWEDGYESINTIHVVTYNQDGSIYFDDKTWNNRESNLRPVIYLKEDLVIESGDGKTEETAYRFSVK